MVFGEYDYNDPYPWLKLAEDNTANDLNEAEMAVIKQYVKQYQENEKNYMKVQESPEIDLASS